MENSDIYMENINQFSCRLSLFIHLHLTYKTFLIILTRNVYVYSFLHCFLIRFNILIGVIRRIAGVNAVHHLHHVICLFMQFIDRVRRR